MGNLFCRGTFAAVIGVLSLAGACEAAEGDEPQPYGKNQWLEEYCGLCEPPVRFHPATPWLKWGGDLMLRETYANNLDFQNTGQFDERHFQYFRARLWTTVTPVKELDVETRLVWSGVNVCDGGSASREMQLDEVSFDLLNVKWSDVFGLPLTAKVGRQDLLFGDGWLIRDGTPLDYVTTTYFDAARFTFDLENVDTTVDAVYIENHADPSDVIRPFNDRDDERYWDKVDVHDTRGAILYVANRSLPATQIDGYFIYKHNGEAMDFVDLHLGDYYTFGGRVAGDVTESWQYRAEYAYQFAKRGVYISAWEVVPWTNDEYWSNHSYCNATAFDGRLTYRFNDKHDNALHLEYEYRSGQPGFDMLWGDYRRYSDLVLCYSSIDG